MITVTTETAGILQSQQPLSLLPQSQKLLSSPQWPLILRCPSSCRGNAHISWGMWGSEITLTVVHRTLGLSHFDQFWQSIKCKLSCSTSSMYVLQEKVKLQITMQCCKHCRLSNYLAYNLFSLNRLWPEMSWSLSYRIQITTIMVINTAANLDSYCLHDRTLWIT